ncbi:hypothetical protein [Rothia sp. LK2492]|uniref:hypothetical protein n=1 Tax=Rothia sp. LK2492 TaxID=3114370 RepID=UPI0034CF250F
MSQLSFSSSNADAETSKDTVGTRCILHTAGHGIVPAVDINASNKLWEKATVLEQRGTRLKLQTADGAAYFWHHDPQRIAYLCAPEGGDNQDIESDEKAAAPVLLFSSSHKLLGRRIEGSFPQAHLSDEPLDACELAPMLIS